MEKKVKVYSTQVCPWCHTVKQFLSKHGVKFEEVDVSRDHEQAQAMIKKSGQMGVPVTEIGEEIVVGFDEARLRKALGLKK